ncbi:MAG: hypothetical protein AAB618_00990 [Patescibacteria group bacterium]
MAKFDKRREAYELRKLGFSINNIAAQLGVSKSSVSVWCRDLILTKTQQQRLKQNSYEAGHKGRLIGAEMNRQKRLSSIKSYEEKARLEIGNLTNRDLTVLATALFWAEGAKTGSRFVFINSDPDMILIVMKYLTKVLKIERSQINATIQINRIHEKRIEEIYYFWCSLLQIPRDQLGRPYYIDVVPKKEYENQNSYKGILRLRVNNGASLQYKLLGYISALRLQK